VVVPAALSDIYTDMRILLGWAWTYLIVAEVVGTMSGITFFINQQARYRNFDNVYAAIFMIGIIGFTSDMLLASFANVLFPWKRRIARRKWRLFEWLAEPEPSRRKLVVPTVTQATGTSQG
jgi:NitT/TauT family transport system permease protein